jgi:hypothetical protein
MLTFIKQLIMIKIRSIKILLFLLLLSEGLTTHAQTTVEKQGKARILLIDGKPFDVKGVTFGYDKQVDHYDSYFRDLQSLGVNTIRTWGNQGAYLAVARCSS